MKGSDGMDEKRLIRVDFGIDDMSTEMILMELFRRYKQNLQDAPRYCERFVKHKSLILPIWDNHTAEIVLTEDAYDELMNL